MTDQIIDANIIVRYLINDNPPLHKKASTILNKALDNQEKLFIDSVTIAEIIWVLKSFYKQDRTTIAAAMLKIISQPWFTTDRPQILTQALNFFNTHNLSYIDCWLYCLAQSKKMRLTTFDTKLAKQN